MSKNKKIQESEDEFEDTDNMEEDIFNEDDQSYDNEDELDNEDFDIDNNCLIDKTLEEDNIFFDNLINSEIKPELEEIIVPNDKRISSNRLTKYEMVRILGERTKQITMGAKPLIKNYEHLSYDKIAEEELKLNMTPFKIKRPLPNGKYEIWTIDELKKDHLLYLLEN